MPGRPNPRDDVGETLVEILMAVVIMGIGIVGLLGALSMTVVSTDSHRRLSDTEVYARTYGEAVKNKALRPATATLTQAVANHAVDSSFDIYVGVPTSPFPAAPYGIAIDGEVLSVTNVVSLAPGSLPLGSVAKWTVKAAGAEPHANGATVTSYESCPTSTDLQPTSFTPPAAITQIDTPKVTIVQYYAPHTSTPLPNCSTYWSTGESVCRSQGDVHRTECDPALIKATVSVTSTDSDTRKKSSTTTEVLIRRGNA